MVKDVCLTPESRALTLSLSLARGPRLPAARGSGLPGSLCPCSSATPSLGHWESGCLLAAVPAQPHWGVRGPEGGGLGYFPRLHTIAP